MGPLFIIGIFFSFFLQFLLFSKKNKTVVDKILGSWMFFIGLHLLNYYAYHLGYWDKFPHLTGITHPFPLLYGPFLYLYVVFSIRKTQIFRKKDFLHFLPAILSYLYMFPYFFLYSEEKKRLVDSGQLTDYRVFMMISLVGFVVSGVAYTILSYRLIGRFNKMVHENLSYDENINLNWLRYCIIGVFGIFLTVGIFSAIQYLLHLNLPFNPDFIYYSEVILFILFIGYFGIRHESLFIENVSIGTVQEEEKPENKTSAEYKKSGLKTDDAEVYHNQLQQLMTSKKPFLEPKLTLNTLANELGITVNHISQVINQFQGKNFYDFVNEYRIEEFKTRALSQKNKHLSLLAIALDSGFNSKSSFNSVFKKHTGMTPSQFLEKEKQELML
jgi:AraC-like DNA-binding protein